MAIGDFFYNYFVSPIYSGTGYNVYNTLAYLVLLLLCISIIYKIFKRIGFTWDSRAFLSLAPYIATISFARVLTDAGIWQRGFWTTTPGIDFLVLLPAFALMFVLYLALKERYFKPFLAVGIVSAIVPLFFQAYTNIMGFLLIAVYLSLSIVPVVLLRGKIPMLKDSTNFLIMLAHLFDAAATSVSLRFFDYFEQHVFPSFVISFTFPEIMFVLKYLFVGLAVYLIKDEKGEMANFIRATILFLGLGPALRDMLRLVALV